MKTLLSVKKTVVCILVAGVMSVATLAFAGDNEQFVPIAFYRTGPAAHMGLPLLGGWFDWLDLVNIRDGGINGVKVAYEFCETEFKVDRMVECYERLKNKGPTGASMFACGATGAVYALLERAATDKIPLINYCAGRTDSADGRVFPWAFPLGTNYWSANTAKIRFIGDREGGMDKLKGKKIVNLYLGVAFGKETIPVLNIQAKKYGFTVTHLEVTYPGIEQQSQWLQIRQIKPDWVILRTYGVSTPAALKAAQKIGFPTNRIIGSHTANAEGDMIPAGDAAKGYIAITMYPAGKDYTVIKEIQKYLYSGGKKGNADPEHIGTHYYNYGLNYGFMTTEPIRTAQEKFGKKPLTGEQVRWGLENLNIDEKHINQLGASGLLQPIKTSCSNHEGGGAAKFMEWNGKRWVAVTKDWVKGDQSIVRPLIEASALQYAKDKGITPRDCSKEN